MPVVILNKNGANIFCRILSSCYICSILLFNWNDQTFVLLRQTMQSVIIHGLNECHFHNKLIQWQMYNVLNAYFAVFQNISYRMILNESTVFFFSRKENTFRKNNHKTIFVTVSHSCNLLGEKASFVLRLSVVCIAN